MRPVISDRDNWGGGLWSITRARCLAAGVGAVRSADEIPKHGSLDRQAHLLNLCSKIQLLRCGPLQKSVVWEIVTLAGDGLPGHPVFIT